MFVRPILTAAISIHAPREGSDASGIAPRLHRGTFLSTLPVRGATACRGRPDFERVIISIHAPREGSDGWWCP